MLVEGIEYCVDWTKFNYGYSFFVPCINPYRARMAANREAKILKVRMFTKVVVEDGVRGLRIWRV